MKKKNNLVNRFSRMVASISLLLVPFISSCVEEFKVSRTITETYDGEMVIHGRILAGEESVFHLSRTVPFSSDDPYPIIRDAQVSIIGENGFRSELATYEAESNGYIIDTKDLKNDTQYAVEVSIDGEMYRSQFQPLKVSPPIDELTYQENGDNISIHVNTHDENDASRFYMWSYEEDWEFHAEIDFIRVNGMVPIYNKEVHYPLVQQNVNPYYYCWMSNFSRNIHLYSTDNLQENSVKNAKLLEIPMDDIRISFIYSILVKQWSMSDAAYNYYKTLKLYTEESGGLFTPMPTEITGNVYCVSNPDKKARGYVMASTVESKRLFVYASDFTKATPTYENCYMQRGDGPMGTMGWGRLIDDHGYIALSPYGMINSESLLYSYECVNCLETKGATKKRPIFWPNNHE